MEVQNLGVLGMVMEMLSSIALFTLSPRFILSVRELYIRDAQRQRQTNSGVDTGFGLSGLSRSIISFANREGDTLQESAVELP